MTEKNCNNCLHGISNDLSVYCCDCDDFSYWELSPLVKLENERNEAINVLLGFLSPEGVAEATGMKLSDVLKAAKWRKMYDWLDREAKRSRSQLRAN